METTVQPVGVVSASTTSPVTLSDTELDIIKARAKSTFVRSLDQAIQNVVALSGMLVPEVREVAAGRDGTLKAIKIDASPTALQANLAIIDRALGKPTERMEGSHITVPIQINMGNGRVVDVQAQVPVTVAMTPETPAP